MLRVPTSVSLRHELNKHWHRCYVLSGICVLLLLYTGCATDSKVIVEERPQFGKFFKDRNVSGVFVLHDQRDDRYFTNDLDRASHQFLPASTYKILNSLIALETGVVDDTSTVFEWDGTERSIPQWNRDHSLASAFANSAVWVYQEVARAIGKERMQFYVSDVGYGNEQIAGDIDRFWLSGDLRISALEQIDFLERLQSRQLSFSDTVVDRVEGIMIEEVSEGATLYGKSGWATGEPADLGWYVGYVQTSDNVYFFALNMDIVDETQGRFRRGIARAILNDVGVLERP